MKKVLLLTLSILSLTGCFGEKSPEKGPEETITEFCNAVLSGEFDKAESMCDTLTMRDYINNIRTKWSKGDSLSKTIVPKILSETKIEIGEIVKGENERTVSYKLNNANCISKNKIAVLTNEEGEWKIKSITDKN